MSDRPSLQAQIDALEGNVLSRRAYLARVESLWNDPKHGTRVQAESMATRITQPALEAGLETLKYLQRHESAFRELMAAKRDAA